MIGFIAGVVAMVAVLIFGDAVLGINPTFGECILVIAACVLADIVEALVKGDA